MTTDLNGRLTALLRQVEAAVDATPGLTRVRRSGFQESARMSFDAGGWSVLVEVRNTRARGRGSRGYYAAQGDGETPEAAVASFVDRLPLFLQVTS